MYTYGMLIADVAECARLKATVSKIGESELGRDIFCVAVGKGKPVIITAGIHAREHVSSEYCMRMAESVAAEPIDGYEFYFIPMVNPDGNTIVSGRERSDVLLKINGSADFSLYKANARGVDLNVNFPARWGTGVSNIFYPSGSDCVGERPLSESESRSLAEFTEKVQPVMTLSFHAKGREVYWKFFQKGRQAARDRKIAAYIAKRLKCSLVDGERGSAGGYKDYCVSRFKIPSFTVELVSDSCLHPLRRDSVYEDIALAKGFLKDLTCFIERSGINL